MFHKVKYIETLVTLNVSKGKPTTICGNCLIMNQVNGWFQLKKCWNGHRTRLASKGPARQNRSLREIGKTPRFMPQQM